MATNFPLTPRSRRLSLLSGAAIVFLTGVALAGVYKHAATHTTKKSVDHVVSVLTAYGQYCNSGCKYYGPDVVTFEKVSYDKKPGSWYTWTHVSTTMKDVKYYNKVSLTKKPDGSVVMNTRQLDDRDVDALAALKEHHGKEHSPAFDRGVTVFTITDEGEGNVKVVQDMSMTASGMIDMFGGKIMDGMKAGAAATFKNIEK